MRTCRENKIIVLLCERQPTPNRMDAPLVCGIWYWVEGSQADVDHIPRIFAFLIILFVANQFFVFSRNRCSVII